MKQIPIILVAVISIALGIWLGMPEQKPVTGYEHLGGDFVVQSAKGDVKLEDFRGRSDLFWFCCLPRCLHYCSQWTEHGVTQLVT